MSHVFIIMREKDIRTDGYYYESETTIIGIRNTPEEATKLLKASPYVAKHQKWGAV